MTAMNWAFEFKAAVSSSTVHIKTDATEAHEVGLHKFKRRVKIGRDDVG